MNAAVRRPPLLHASLRCGNNTIRKTHAPRKLGRNTVVAVAAEQAADASDSVAGCRGRTACIQKCKRRNFFTPAQGEQRGEASQKSAEPRKPKTGIEKGPRMRQELGGRFQNVVKARANNACESGNADDQKRITMNSASAKISLQHVRRTKQTGGDHQSKGRKQERTNVQIRDHLSVGESQIKVYMSDSGNFASRISGRATPMQCRADQKPNRKRRPFRLREMAGKFRD